MSTTAHEGLTRQLATPRAAAARVFYSRFIPPQVPDQLKTNYADECYNPSGIVPRAVSMIKERFPDSIVCTDVALDPYSDQGHDGVVKDGKILNDETIMQLTKQVGGAGCVGLWLDRGARRLDVVGAGCCCWDGWDGMGAWHDLS